MVMLMTKSPIVIMNCSSATTNIHCYCLFLLFPVPEENSTWLDTYRFEWNETSLTYTLLIDWTVPCVNGFCNIVERFHIFVVYPRVPFSSHCVRAATFEVIALLLTLRTVAY